MQERPLMSLMSLPIWSSFVFYISVQFILHDLRNAAFIVSPRVYSLTGGFFLICSLNFHYLIMLHNELNSVLPIYSHNFYLSAGSVLYCMKTSELSYSYCLIKHYSNPVMFSNLKLLII